MGSQPLNGAWMDQRNNVMNKEQHCSTFCLLHVLLQMKKLLLEARILSLAFKGEFLLILNKTVLMATDS